MIFPRGVRPSITLVLLLPLLFVAVALVVAPRQVVLGAQPSPTSEEEIRRLEQLEVRAVLARDRDTLRTIWDSGYIVNNPQGVIAEANAADPTDRPVMQMARVSMTRTTEKVAIRGDVAFAMGNETIVPGEGQPRTGQTVTRRYTNIWMKQSTGWKLMARHANVVCP
jgi:ketosteroid isomerase-like protein